MKVGLPNMNTQMDSAKLNLIIFIPAGREPHMLINITNAPQYAFITYCLHEQLYFVFWKVQVHSRLEPDILSDCLARQHLHSSATSHQGNSSPLPGLNDFTGTHSSKNNLQYPSGRSKTEKGLST